MSVNLVPTVIYSGMMGMAIFALFDVLNRPKHKQTLFLTALLVLLLIHILGELYIYTGAYVYAPGLAGLDFPIRVLLGPALYFYAFATMSPERSLSKKSYLLALCGPIIILVGMVPFLMISPEDKLAMATPATRDAELFKIALFTCLFSNTSFVTFTFLYLAATFKLQNRHRQQLMERFSSIEKRSMDWFRVSLILWGTVWFLFSVEYTISFFGWRWFGKGTVLPILEAFTIMTFSHYALKQSVLKDSEKAQPMAKQGRSYGLGSEQLANVANKLKHVMEQDNLYMEEDLSLKRLSEATEVSENHISETLSQHLQTNFFRYVNGYRIELAKRLLATTSKNVSTIAYDVGFNSKSTFNSAFKRSSGMTPTAFRNANFGQNG